MHYCYNYTYLGLWLLLLALSPSLTSGDDDLDPLAKTQGSKFASFFPPPGKGDAETLATRLKCVRGLEGKDHYFKCPQYLRGEDGSVLCKVGACYVMETTRKNDPVERGCYCAPNPDLRNKCVSLSGKDPDGYGLRMCLCDASHNGCCNMDEPPRGGNGTDYPKTNREENCRNFDDYDEAKKNGGKGGDGVTKAMKDYDHDGRGSEYGEGHSFQPSAKSIFLALISLVFLKALFYR